jgi:UDP-N-acetylmuramate: L-alanyl-gamma-D-glutamyl-meso-diaminopimelate ligase
MHIHILGICGTFMGGLAALAREAGHTVTGCDAGVYPPMSDQLRALGIELIEGFDASQMALKPDVFVIGNVVSRARKPDGTPKFPLMEAILDAGAPYTSGPQWLAEHVLQGRHVLAWPAPMARHHHVDAGLDSGKRWPGARLPGRRRTGQFRGLGAPGWRDGAGFCAGQGGARTAGGGHGAKACAVSPPPPFRHRSRRVRHRLLRQAQQVRPLPPAHGILNNLEFDHADIFDDLAAIERQFHHLVRTVASTGRVVVNGLEESLTRVLHAGCWSEVRSFGSAVCDFTAEGEPGHFDVLERGVRVATVDWPLGGVHNQLNALAAIAAAEHVGVSPAIAAQALGTFQNVKRRMEVRGTVNGITVYDDFAHHPTAIRTTLDGLRRQVGPNARILAVFEPRSNTMKLGTMKAQLPGSLIDADLAFCHSGGLDWDARAALTPMGERAQVADSIDALVAQVTAKARPGDHILCMSNGGFGGVHARLLQSLQNK